MNISKTQNQTVAIFKCFVIALALTVSL